MVPALSDAFALFKSSLSAQPHPRSSSHTLRGLCSCARRRKAEPVHIGIDNLTAVAAKSVDRGPASESTGIACHKQSVAKSQGELERPDRLAFDMQLQARCTLAGTQPQNILAAVQTGRIIEARRELRRLEAAGVAPQTCLRPCVLEQINNAGNRFDTSMNEVKMEPSKGWVKQWLPEGIELGHRLEGNTFTFMSTTEYDGCDIIRAFAAICEIDLCKGYKPNVEHAEPLGAWNPTDSIWRVSQRGFLGGQLEDNIFSLNVIDALDEPVRSLWASIEVPLQEDVLQSNGVTIPPPQQGRTRCSAGKSTVHITPIGDESDSSNPRFRMTMVLSGPVPRATTLMPAFALKAFVRRFAKEMVGNFWTHTHECDELDRRIWSSPRAGFYTAIRQHLRGEPLGPAFLHPIDNASSQQMVAGSVTPATMTPATSVSMSSTSSETCKDSDCDDWDACTAATHVYEQLEDFLKLDDVIEASSGYGSETALAAPRPSLPEVECHVNDDLIREQVPLTRLEDFLAILEKPY